MKYATLAGTELPRIYAWANRLISDLNKAADPVSSYPVYADDAAAATSGLPVGGGYVTAAGAVRRRMA